MEKTSFRNLGPPKNCPSPQTRRQGPGLRHCLVLFYLRELCRPLFLCSRTPYTAVFCPWRFGVPVRPLCGNAEPFLFKGWSNNLAPRLSHQKHLINGACSQFNQLFVLFRFAWVRSASG